MDLLAIREYDKRVKLARAKPFWSGSVQHVGNFGEDAGQKFFYAQILAQHTFGDLADALLYTDRRFGPCLL